MEPTSDQSVAAVFRLLVGNWKILGLCAGLGLVLGISYYFIADRVYESEVVAQPARDAEDTLRDISSLTSQLGAVASLAGITPSRGSRYDQVVALLTSRGFFETFDRRVGFRAALQSRASEGMLGRHRDAEMMTIRQAHDVFHGKFFTLVEDPTTSVVWLRVRSWSPDLSARWVNEVVTTLNEIASEKDRVLSERMLEYLAKERDKTEHIETREAISALIRRETERKMLANVTKDYAFTVIDAGHPSDPRDFVAPALSVSVIIGCALGLLVGGAIVVIRQ